MELGKIQKLRVESKNGKKVFLADDENNRVLLAKGEGEDFLDRKSVV